MLRFVLGVCAMFAGISAARAAEPTVVQVWPGDPPGEKASAEPEKVFPPKADEQPPIERVTNVSRPTLTVYSPEGKNTQTAVVICPGGGYSILAVGHEGRQVAEWLNTIGVTGIVLKYRVPARKDQPRHQAPLQDAQRAMSLVRTNAAKWGIAPDRIGILGFSAGGHLAAAASTNFDHRQYEPLDAVDQASCRPDFSVLVYPAYLTKGDTLADEIRVSPQTPPALFIHAGDDRIVPDNSLQMYQALRRAGVPAEVHIFAAGGHGFGMKPSDHPIAGWPKLCEQWLRRRGLLTNP